MTDESGLATRLHSALVKHATTTGRVRVTLTTLFHFQAEIEGHTATRPGARTRLRDALADLAGQGRLEQPVSRQLWDHSSRPPLPAWVTVITDLPRRVTPVDPGAVTWAPSISRWVGQWARESRPAATMWETLKAINTWMLGALASRPPVVAREERSLDIFEDEKRLARIESTSMFTPNRLSPEQLAYQRPVAPMRAARLAGRGHLLIVENQSTFDSAWRSLARQPGPFAAVAFGNGWEASSAEPLLQVVEHLQLDEFPSRIWYAGDIDIDGLDIPQTLAANLSSHERPGPEPLVAAYEAMIGNRSSDDALVQTPADSSAIQASTWLPPHLRAATAAIVAKGHRVAQERLDRSWWASPAWHPGSTD